MSPELLLTHFDRISNVPDAVPRLRRFILDLAVRGKLVGQYRKDETASVLIKRIQAEKARLIKTGEIRKEKPLPVVNAEEVPFVIPAQWHWVRIREVTSDRGQTSPNGDFTYIDVTSIDKEVGRVADAKVLSSSDAPSRARKQVQKGDVLYSCVRPYLLNIAIIESDMVPTAIVSTAFAVLNGFGLVLPRYLWIALRSPFMVGCVEAKMRGQAYPAINDADFSLLPLPLPPLAEQHRIAAKVDELMALCDGLEVAKAEQERRRQRLAMASLHRLSDGANAEGFRGYASFYLNHLPRLTTSPHHIKQLRQTILNLATHGRLAAQEANDEPVVELLCRIKVEQAEQTELAQKRRLMRNAKPLSLSDNEGLFELPLGWKWVALSDVIVFGPQNGISPEPSSRIDAPKAITLSATTKGTFDPTYYKHVEAVVPKDSEFWLRPGDLLFQRGNTREYVGMAAYYTGDSGAFLYPDLMMKVRLSAAVELRYVHLCTVAPYARTYLSNEATGAQPTMPKINQGILLGLPIPLPPFAEQQRIVAKVDELIALCDRLEEQLTVAQAESRRLLEAILDEALNDNRAVDDKLKASNG